MTASPDLWQAALRDPFARGYADAALWATLDDRPGEGHGEPLERSYGVNDIHPATLATMLADCRAFEAQHGGRISDDVFTGTYDGNVYEACGWDLWMTRNGHGVGFWDGDWADDVAADFAAAARKLGEYHLYVGDDGMVHGARG